MAFAGLRAGAQFEHLAQQYQGDDDRRRLEIDRHRSVRHPERCGEYSRQQHRDQAVDIGDAGAERDQSEHVEPAVADRSPASPEKRPPAPQNDRCREHELRPRPCRGIVASARICSPMTIAVSGTVSAAAPQNRRVILRSSGLAVSPAAGVIGSSAIPQIGQLPARCARSADASGRSTGASPDPTVAPERGRAQITRRVGFEPLAASACRKSNRPGRRARRDAGPRPDRLSCRRPDRARRPRARAPSRLPSPWARRSAALMACPSFQSASKPSQ